MLGSTSARSSSPHGTGTAVPPAAHAAGTHARSRGRRRQANRLCLGTGLLRSCRCFTGPLQHPLLPLYLRAHAQLLRSLSPRLLSTPRMEGGRGSRPWEPAGQRHGAGGGRGAPLPSPPSGQLSSCGRTGWKNSSCLKTFSSHRVWTESCLAPLSRGGGTRRGLASPRSSTVTGELEDTLRVGYWNQKRSTSPAKSPRTRSAGPENCLPGSVGCCWAAGELPGPELLAQGGKQPGLGSWRKPWKSSSFLCCSCSSSVESNRRKRPSRDPPHAAWAGSGRRKSLDCIVPRPLGTASSRGVTKGGRGGGGRGRTWRCGQKVQAVPSCRAAPGSHCRGGSMPWDHSGPRMFPGHWEPELGKARLNRGQVAWLGPGQPARKGL